MMCYVFGPKNAGKSALPFQNSYALDNNNCYKVNAVDQLRGTKKTLILRKIQEDDVKEFLSSKESPNVVKFEVLESGIRRLLHCIGLHFVTRI
ncbi:unnamed protein product [Lactuca virosa]|uniref:Uncharacterized protein n=1 Tax=Lactuca virosa TaxID=75947 RepID=A0AAU9PT54_9ASTR|nr:unnamed protein product [Lactuca virosa]